MKILECQFLFDFFVKEFSFKIANMRQMSMYGREHPSPEVEKGQWIEYCRREERIQKYMCQKNGQEGFKISVEKITKKMFETSKK